MSRVLFLCVAVVLGCSSNPPAKPRTAKELAPQIDPPGWDQVVALAKPLGASGPTTELEAALAIAARQGGTWAARRAAAPAGIEPPPMVEFPELEQAIGALSRWAAAGGGVVPYASPTSADATPAPLLQLPLAAIAVSGVDRLEPLRASAALGQRLTTLGSTLIESMVGVAIIEAAIDRLRVLNRPFPRDLIPPDAALTRALAVEGVFQRGEFIRPLSEAGLAASKARGQTLTEADARDIINSVAAVNRRWVTLLGTLTPATTRAEFGERLSAVLATPFADAAGAVIDPLGIVVKYTDKFSAMLDKAHLQAAVPEPAPPAPPAVAPTTP